MWQDIICKSPDKEQEDTDFMKNTEIPVIKRRRGRPRKNPLPEVTAPVLEVVEDNSQPQSKSVFNVRVVKQHPNPSWVRCDHDGTAIDVQIPNRLAGRLIGKVISVEQVWNGDEETTYRYVQ